MVGPFYPNVPQTTGVPAVQRDATNPPTSNAPAQLSGDSITVSGFGATQWGIYAADGSQVLKADTVSAVSYAAESRIADFPIEQGGFETYDKVNLPEMTHVVLTKGGTWEDRRAFLSDLDNIRTDLNLYSVVTPERAYLNANIERINIDRTRERGAGLISVEIALREIRQNTSTQFSNTRDPASSAAVKNGNAQTSANSASLVGVQ